ncbi:MAG: hypothetical protein WBX18_04005, partial [Terracidiphilus sp.]
LGATSMFVDNRLTNPKAFFVLRSLDTCNSPDVKANRDISAHFLPIFPYWTVDDGQYMPRAVLVKWKRRSNSHRQTIVY